MSGKKRAKGSKPRARPRPEIAARFAENLRLLREKCGLSQEKLSEQAGMHRASVGNLERGKRGNPTLGVIDALARAVGVDIRLMLEPQAPGPPPEAGK